MTMLRHSLASTTRSLRRQSSSVSRRFLNGHSSNNNDSERLLVVGSGVAGSSAALIAAETYQIPVTLLYAGQLPTDCNSYWAQGGIIYEGRANSMDSPELLASDIHRAGAGLCDHDAVSKVCHEGPSRVRQLLLNRQPTSAFCNVPFDRDPDKPNELALCLEASHSASRILHSADHTGKTITEYITKAVSEHPLIEQVPHTVVTDLLVQDNECLGVQTLQGNYYAQYGTVLATGGLAGIFKFSTNPTGFNALGSSVAMACRANVQTRDLEYVQFHPTALNLPHQPSFLLTEALRGEGAKLRNHKGVPFAKRYHPDGELAPRDIVARAVFSELKHGPVYLDITHRNADWLHQRFPTIAKHLSSTSTAPRLDLAKHPLPITPAAHYTCGGIATDLHGQSSLPRLYAAGESARTGLHGGNRLASTSLLEGLVFGSSVADHVAATAQSGAANIAAYHQQLSATSSTPVSSSSSSHRNDAAAVKLLEELRHRMWENVGVTRTPTGLLTAVEDLHDICEAADHLHHEGPSRATAAVRDAATAGQAVARAALANRVSKGAHCIVEDEEDVSDEEEMMASAVAR